MKNNFSIDKPSKSMKCIATRQLFMYVTFDIYHAYVIKLISELNTSNIIPDHVFTTDDFINSKSTIHDTIKFYKIKITLPKDSVYSWSSKKFNQLMFF